MSGLPSLGATYLGEGRVQFHLWAPFAKKVEVSLLGPAERRMELQPQRDGYFSGISDRTQPSARYVYRLEEGEQWPDPASRFQPEGVHGPSQVYHSAFIWGDEDWVGIPIEDYVIYELHVGTFTPEGSFEAILPFLRPLKELGITAVELMPVGQFPGSRNWGYDGVYPFAVQNSYGGPEGLKNLVNACHQSGLAVILDVVCNHLGPEGNYLKKFGPYFTDRYHSPWGEAVNFDGARSDPVRRYFLENARYWIREFHFDALRIDAIHGIYDNSAIPFLAELAGTIQKQNQEGRRRVYAFAESDLNDVKVIRSREQGGFGFDAQWSDDFHHALHVLLTGEKRGYYQDFGELGDLAKAYRGGFVYTGQHSAYRRRRHGNESKNFSPGKFVIFSQNHDQIGNRMRGERLSRLVPFEALKLAAAAVLLSANIPLLFMGEEYGETAPFPYFISHSDPQLVQAVLRGRRADFREFAWEGEPPDPQGEATFQDAKLNHALKREGHHQVLSQFYRELLRLRKEIAGGAGEGPKAPEVQALKSSRLLSVYRKGATIETCLHLHFDSVERAILWEARAGTWKKSLDSSAIKWQGPGERLPGRCSPQDGQPLTFPPWSAALWVRESES